MTTKQRRSDKIYHAVLDLIYVSDCENKTLDLWALAV